MPLPSSDNTSAFPSPYAPHLLNPTSSKPSSSETPTYPSSPYPPLRPSYTRSASSYARPRKDSLSRSTPSQLLLSTRRRRLLRLVERVLLAPLPREADPSGGGVWCYVLAAAFWVCVVVMMRAVGGWGYTEPMGGYPALAPLPPSVNSPAPHHLPYINFNPSHAYDSDAHAHPNTKWYRAGLLKTLRKAHSKFRRALPLSVPRTEVGRAEPHRRDVPVPAEVVEAAYHGFDLGEETEEAGVEGDAVSESMWEKRSTHWDEDNEAHIMERELVKRVKYWREEDEEDEDEEPLDSEAENATPDEVEAEAYEVKDVDEPDAGGEEEWDEDQEDTF